jgi:cyclase
MKALEFCKLVENMGAGEILLNSVDRDGVGNGYDIDLLSLVSETVKIPVIACGGVGDWHHFEEALNETKVDAVAAANIFHFRDQSVYLAKRYLFDRHLNVRKPSLIKL